MDNQNGDSGANTVLLVIVLLIIVGVGAWWLTMRNNSPAPQDSKVNVDVKLPTGYTTPPTTQPAPQPAAQ